MCRAGPFGVPGAPQKRSKTYPGAPMGSQIYPSGSKQCAKWAQGYENDLQSGPKRPQMVLKGRLKWSQSGTRRSLKGPQTYKQINTKHVVENWRAFRHVVQCLSKWNLQAE